MKKENYELENKARELIMNYGAEAPRVVERLVREGEAMKAYEAKDKERKANRSYAEILNEHLKKQGYDGVYAYLTKVLDRSGLLSSSMKQAIYERVGKIHKAIEESLHDDLGEIRHNYGAAEYGRGEAEHSAWRDYERSLDKLKPLEERVFKMKNEELRSAGGADI